MSKYVWHWLKCCAVYGYCFLNHFLLLFTFFTFQNNTEKKDPFSIYIIPQHWQIKILFEFIIGFHHFLSVCKVPKNIFSELESTMLMGFSRRISKPDVRMNEQERDRMKREC